MTKKKGKRITGHWPTVYLVDILVVGPEGNVHKHLSYDRAKRIQTS